MDDCKPDTEEGNLVNLEKMRAFQEKLNIITRVRMKEYPFTPIPEIQYQIFHAELWHDVEIYRISKLYEDNRSMTKNTTSSSGDKGVKKVAKYNQYFDHIPITGQEKVATCDEGLTDRNWNLMAAGAPTITLSKGQVLIEEGSHSQHVYRIKSGRVRLEKDKQTIRTLGQNAVFGERNVLTAGAISMFRVVADEENTLICQMDLPFLSKVFEGNPRLAHVFFQILATRLAKQLREQSANKTRTPTLARGHEAHHNEPNVDKEGVPETKEETVVVGRQAQSESPNPSRAPVQNQVRERDRDSYEFKRRCSVPYVLYRRETTSSADNQSSPSISPSPSPSPSPLMPAHRERSSSVNNQRSLDVVDVFTEQPDSQLQQIQGQDQSVCLDGEKLGGPLEPTPKHVNSIQANDLKSMSVDKIEQTRDHKMSRKFALMRDEMILQEYKCTLVKRSKVAYSGDLYVLQTVLGFHSKSFGIETKEVIHFTEIASVSKKENDPLAINLQIESSIDKKSSKYTFKFKNQRDEAFGLIESLWQRFRDDKKKRLIHGSSALDLRTHNSGILSKLVMKSEKEKEKDKYTILSKTQTKRKGKSLSTISTITLATSSSSSNTATINSHSPPLTPKLHLLHSSANIGSHNIVHLSASVDQEARGRSSTRSRSAPKGRLSSLSPPPSTRATVIVPGLRLRKGDQKSSGSDGRAGTFRENVRFA
eukprot:TRINITY_DN178_c0_g2_i1.p1 TRINITY_DN178_c0_g2~~TRINITY_DN178_c0_g2_i1.p1  ORF type:complete len:785 (+),score=162.25 TRINITY_DN178_c0_g2_i1:240-2357(+)